MREMWLLVCPSHRIRSVARPPVCQGWKSVFLLCRGFSLCCSELDWEAAVGKLEFKL